MQALHVFVLATLILQYEAILSFPSGTTNGVRFLFDLIEFVKRTTLNFRENFKK